MKGSVDAARLLRESNPVPDHAFAGAAGDSLGRPAFEHIVSHPAKQSEATGRSLRWRRRRLAPRLTAAAAVLTAGAAALVAVVVPVAGHDGTGGSAVDTAYVVKRISSALSAAGLGEIAQVTVTTGGAAVAGGTTATATAEAWSYGDQWRSVTSNSAGHPVYDEGSNASSVYTLVSYLTRTWARQPGSGRPAASLSGPRSCEQVITALPSLFHYELPGTGVPASSLPAATALRAAVSCGTLSEAGRQRVDGIEAIELTSRPDSPIPETIWVSPGTYLPVRVVIRSAPGQPVRWQAADITWLPPTAQNLADKLTVPIPRGFPRVPVPQAIRQASPAKGRPQPNVQETSAGATA